MRVSDAKQLYVSDVVRGKKVWKSLMVPYGTYGTSYGTFSALWVWFARLYVYTIFVAQAKKLAL